VLNRRARPRPRRRKTASRRGRNRARGARTGPFLLSGPPLEYSTPFVGVDTVKKEVDSMTDEARPEGAPETATAVAAPPAEQPPAPEAPEAPAAPAAPGKLRQQVEIKDVGPCKKHIKVSVDRADI